MRFANTRVENWYVPPPGSLRNRKFALRGDGGLVDGPGLPGSRLAREVRELEPHRDRGIFPVSELVPGCWADNAAAETNRHQKRKNDRMDALYNLCAAHNRCGKRVRYAWFYLLLFALEWALRVFYRLYIKEGDGKKKPPLRPAIFGPRAVTAPLP